MDEAYLDLDDLLSPRAAMRRLVTAIRAATGMSASVGIGPNKLVAKVASDAEKPAGLRGAHARAGVRRASPAGRPASCRGSGPRPRRGWSASGSPRCARCATRPGGPAGALRRAPRPVLRRARARFEDSGDVTPARVDGLGVARDHVRLRHRRARPPGGGPAPGSPAQLCEGLARQERRGRTIAIKVRLDDWTTITRARTIPERHQRRGRRVATVALELLREYAPPRPVRLLGVRVASFATDGDAAGRRQRPARARRCSVRARDGDPSIDGTELHHERRGAGEPLLLIQGMSRQPPALGRAVPGRAGARLRRSSPSTTAASGARRGRRAVHDRASSPRTPPALLDALGFESAHVLGISMGGMVAQELVLRPPGRACAR